MEKELHHGRKQKSAENKKPRSAQEKKEIDERWDTIGRLVEKHGTPIQKVAWMLCRGDAAEWKIASEGGIEGIKKALRKRIENDGREA